MSHLLWLRSATREATAESWAAADATATASAEAERSASAWEKATADATATATEAFPLSAQLFWAPKIQRPSSAFRVSELSTFGSWDALTAAISLLVVDDPLC